MRYQAQSKMVSRTLIYQLTIDRVLIKDGQINYFERLQFLNDRKMTDKMGPIYHTCNNNLTVLQAGLINCHCGHLASSLALRCAPTRSYFSLTLSSCNHTFVEKCFWTSFL